MRGLQPGPINTFPKWKDLGRFVKRGEKALTLCMPLTRKRHDDESKESDTLSEGQTYTTFVHRARWFAVSQTYGDELGPVTIPEWDAEQALQTLCIERITFDKTDGNCQGFARLCGQVSYVALNFSSQFSASNQRTERHITTNILPACGLATEWVVSEMQEYSNIQLIFC